MREGDTPAGGTWLAHWWSCLMGSDTNHRGSCQPVLHMGPASKNDLELCSVHWQRCGNAKCRGDNNPWIPRWTGDILSATMAPEGLGRVNGQREGFGALECLLPATILPIRPSAPSNGLAPNGRKAFDVDCRDGRGHFLTTLTKQQQQRLSTRSSTGFTGHDITIGALVNLCILLRQNNSKKLPLSDAKLVDCTL